MKAATNRTGSASAASQLSHADGLSGRVASQSARSIVLPAPAGPTTRASRSCSAWSSESSNRDRRTRPGTTLGTRNFEDGNRGLREPGAAVTVASDTLTPNTTAQASPSVSSTDASPGARAGVYRRIGQGQGRFGRGCPAQRGDHRTQSGTGLLPRVRPGCGYRTELRITRNRVTTRTPPPGTLAASQPPTMRVQSQCGHTYTKSLSPARQTERCAHNSTTARSPQARARPPSAPSYPTRLPSPAWCSGSPDSGLKSPTCCS